MRMTASRGLAQAPAAAGLTLPIHGDRAPLSVAGDLRGEVSTSAWLKSFMAIALVVLVLSATAAVARAS
jgi:hypothetical protein